MGKPSDTYTIWWPEIELQEGCGVSIEFELRTNIVSDIGSRSPFFQTVIFYSVPSNYLNPSLIGLLLMGPFCIIDDDLLRKHKTTNKIIIWCSQ